MGLMEWLRGLLGDGGGSSQQWVYVRCDQCGEALKARVDLSHDLSVQYDERGGVDGYFSRKTLIGGGPCFNQIQVEIQFDQRRSPTDHTVAGGELLSKVEYEQARKREQAPSV